MNLIKGNKKVENAWAFYDWANSVYALVITTAIFPLFYEGITEAKVVFFGYELINTALVSYVSSVIFLIVTFLTPLLSGMADYQGNKKFYLKLFCAIGSLACCGLFFFDPKQLEIGMLIYLIAGVGFWSSLVYYNAYLPEIAHPEDHDRLSAKGYAMGYLGGAILLIICLGIILGTDLGGEMGAKIAFVLTGVWWIGFAQYTYRYLPESPKTESLSKEILFKGYQELKKVWKEFGRTVRLKRYLTSFFVYSMGVQTIMLMAVYFGAKEIAWSSEEEKTTGLIVSILIIQFIAIVGAQGLSRLSTKIGNLNALKIILVMWVGLCVAALWVTTPVDFYSCAAGVGLVMGGVQSLSRSTYAKFLPETKDTSSYFSFYDVAEKIGIVIGTFSYGLVEQLTGSMRSSIFLIGGLFVLGAVLLFRVPAEEVTIDK